MLKHNQKNIKILNLGNKIFNSAIWSSLEKLSIQLISFILGIVLARLLTPDEYGTFGLLLVFITISQVFIDSGFSQALIQRQNRTNTDISTVFFFNIAVAGICYVILYVTAPFIADFYEVKDLKPLLRVLAISLVLNAFFTIPMTLLTIAMDFKAIAKVTLVATTLSGGIAIYCAYIGMGEWSLVVQVLSKGVLMTLLLWMTTKWRPLFFFSKASFKVLFSFGSKLLVSSLLSSILSNLNAILIGKYIGTKPLGFYTRGTQFADIVYSVLNSSLNSVLLPSLSTIQNNNKQLIQYTRTILKMTALITVPLFFGLALLAEPLITVLLSSKWAMAIPIMQIFCFTRLITILVGISSNLLYVVGRTDLTLKQEYVKIAVRLVLLIIALPYGILWIAIAELVSTSIHFFINNYYPGKLFNYGALNQLTDMSKIVFSGCIMVAIGLMLRHYINSDLLQLLLITPFCAAIYYMALQGFKIEEMSMLKSKIASLIKKERKK